MIECIIQQVDVKYGKPRNGGGNDTHLAKEGEPMALQFQTVPTKGTLVLIDDKAYTVIDVLMNPSQRTVVFVFDTDMDVPAFYKDVLEEYSKV